MEYLNFFYFTPSKLKPLGAVFVWPKFCGPLLFHYNDVIMGAMASQITSLTIFYSTVYSGAYQRNHQGSTSLAIVWGIYRGPVNSPHKWPVTRKMFPFDDVIMHFTQTYIYRAFIQLWRCYEEHIIPGLSDLTSPIIWLLISLTGGNQSAYSRSSSITPVMNLTSYIDTRPLFTNQMFQVIWNLTGVWSAVMSIGPLATNVSEILIEI